MAQMKTRLAERSERKSLAEYIVSACLIGRNCVYDGTSNYNPAVKELFDSAKAIALCPEELGGLKTPRPAAEILSGSGEDVLKGKAYVFNEEGKEVTINYIKGSKEFLNIAKEYGVKKAILKARSPSCGFGKIYDGTFSNKLTKGNGVTAALLLKNDIEVITDEEFSKESSEKIFFNANFRESNANYRESIEGDISDHSRSISGDSRSRRVFQKLLKDKKNKGKKKIANEKRKKGKRR